MLTVLYCVKDLVNTLHRDSAVFSIPRNDIHAENYISWVQFHRIIDFFIW